MGSLVESQIRDAIPRWFRHDADAALRSSSATRGSTRCSAQATRSSPHDRHAVARGPRPALPDDARSRGVRARADGRPCARSRSRRASSRRRRRSRSTWSSPRWASSPQTRFDGIVRALVDIDEDRLVRSRRATTRSTTLYHRDLRRDHRLMRRIPATSSAARGSCSRPTSSSGSATASRTSRRMSCSSRPARSRTSTHERSAGPGASSSRLGATAPARSSARRCSAVGGDRIDAYSAGIEPPGVNP